MAEMNACCFVVLALIALALPCILIPLSFKSLEYDQYGFKKQKSTGTVDTSEVYAVGNHFIGPDYEFKTFKATAHMFAYQFSVFTKDKLTIRISVYFQYFLRREHLAMLHKFYDVKYESTVNNQAMAALKIETPRYTTNEFIKNRTMVEEGLWTTVREKLGGACCAVDCDNTWEHGCPAGCIKYSMCDVEKQGGLWVDIKHFQLGFVRIPDFVSERFMEALTLGEKTEREQNMQEAAVFRKKAVQEVAEIKNRAEELKQEAEAQSSLINTISRANYTSIVERARSKGLKDLYTRLGIKDEKTKNSFDYLRTLRGLDHVHLTVDFQQRIVGGFGSG